MGQEYKPSNVVGNLLVVKKSLHVVHVSVEETVHTVGIAAKDSPVADTQSMEETAIVWYK